MIRYALKCAAGCAFDAWFARMDDFDLQKSRGLLQCPLCGEDEVEKDVMSPAVRTGERRAGDDASAMRRALAAYRKHVLATYENVGARFSEEVRDIAEGLAEDRAIYGEASLKDVFDLRESGLHVMPLPDAPADEDMH